MRIPRKCAFSENSSLFSILGKLFHLLLFFTTNLASQISQPPFSYYLFLLIICEYKCKNHFRGKLKLPVPLFFMHKWILYSIASIHALYCVACLAQFCVIYRKGHFETYFFFILYVQMNFVFNCFNSCIVYCGPCLGESELKQVVGSDSLPHPCPP